MKVSPKLKFKLIVSFSALYGAGLLYWLSHLFFRVHGEYGDEPSWVERATGPIHLTAAFLFIFVVGITWSQHIAPAWRTRKHRLTGWVLFGLIAIMAGTGIAVIYGNEVIEKAAGQVHPWIGISLLPLLLVHWNSRRRKV